MLCTILRWGSSQQKPPERQSAGQVDARVMFAEDQQSPARLLRGNQGGLPGVDLVLDLPQALGRGVELRFQPFHG